MEEKSQSRLAVTESINNSRKRWSKSSIPVWRWGQRENGHNAAIVETILLHYDIIIIIFGVGVGDSSSRWCVTTPPTAPESVFSRPKTNLWIIQSRCTDWQLNGWKLIVCPSKRDETFSSSFFFFFSLFAGVWKSVTTSFSSIQLVAPLCDSSLERNAQVPHRRWFTFAHSFFLYYPRKQPRKKKNKK